MKEQALVENSTPYGRSCLYCTENLISSDLSNYGEKIMNIFIMYNSVFTVLVATILEFKGIFAYAFIGW